MERLEVRTQKSWSLLGQVAADVQFGCDWTHRGRDAHSGRECWTLCGRDCRITIQTGRSSALISRTCWRSLCLANGEVMECLRETFAQRIWMCAREFFLSLRLKVLCWLVSVEVKARKLSSFVAWSVQRGVWTHVTHWVCMRQG